MLDISGSGVHSDPEKIDAIRQLEAPTNISEVRRFLGMVNQLGKFIPNLAEKTKPLRDLLAKKNSWDWNIAQENAFKQLKEELTSTPVLAHYDPEKRTIVSADASSKGLGAVLLQEQDGEIKPVAYASRSMTSCEERYAQIEKEALASTWACEKFSDYILGKDIEIETDHKPLVSLLGSKSLHELPPRIQRFRMRLMRYSYTVRYTPGKNIVTADMLSRARSRSVASPGDLNFADEANVYVASVLAALPATEKRLEQIRREQSDDEVCVKLKEFCQQEEWPCKPKLHSSLRAYWPYRGEITVQHGILMMGSRLIIPSSMRLDILDRIHAGHQGIKKCRERANDSVWWPGLSKQIEDMVTTCSICCKERQNHAEPMIESEFPARPWQKIGTDLFQYMSTDYVIAVDYYSRFFEMSPLKQSTSQEVIAHLKSYFARHGIPKCVMSDNGTQYSSGEFAKFSAEWGFTHLTSSPKFPQSNGEVERAVETAKSLLRKAHEDRHLSLLAYRSTPLQNGFSPAELLMGRKLRTTLPVSPEKLRPSWPDLDEVQRKEKEYKHKQAVNFDRRHNAAPLTKLQPGDKVWVTDQKTSGTVVETAGKPRSYIVETEKSTLTRNRKHLVPDPKRKTTTEPLQEIPQVNEEAQRQPDPRPEAVPSQPMTTRSGRVINPPKRLDV